MKITQSEGKGKGRIKCLREEHQSPQKTKVDVNLIAGESISLRTLPQKGRPAFE